MCCYLQINWQNVIPTLCHFITQKTHIFIILFRNLLEDQIITIMEEDKLIRSDGNSVPFCTKRRMKYISLLILTFLNVTVGFSMRYSRTRSGDLFFEGTTVLLTEVMKLLTCLILTYLSPDEGAKDVRKLLSILHKRIIENKIDTLKVCIPSFMYIVHNNLMYVAAEHLDIATLTITFQLKIFTTAICAALILKTVLSKTQWISLFLLVVGVAMVQLSDSKEATESAQKVTRIQYRIFGFTAALAACVLSGLAGIYFEKILKGSDVSLWMRNIQLSVLGIPFGLIVSFVQHFQGIQEKGFFFGYDLFVIYLVALNAGHGLIVAVVVKYADNIIKGFAHSLAVVITCFVSIFIFDFVASPQFAVGAVMVVVSMFMYGYKPKSSEVAQTEADKTDIVRANTVEVSDEA